MKSIAKLLLPLLFISLHCKGIVIRHDKDPNLYQAKQTQYPSVVNLDFLMGTLIAPQWIVTAAHGTPLMPGGQQLLINGKTYTVDKIIVHPQYHPEESRPILEQQDHDIALLKLSTAVKDVQFTDTYTQEDEAGQTVWFVGEGMTGNGKDGITGGSDGLYRAQNQIEKTDEKWLHFDFDSPSNNPLLLEGVSAPGDSGGPAFIQTPDGLQIAGVSSHQLDNSAGEANVYGVTEKYTRISTYLPWITKTMHQSDEQLEKVALKHPKYQAIESTQSEHNELTGQYEVEGMPTLIIALCPDKTSQPGLCYQWEGQSKFTLLQKTDKDLWFTPKLNRTIEVLRGENGTPETLQFHGYMGGMLAVKQ